MGSFLREEDAAIAAEESFPEFMFADDDSLSQQQQNAPVTYSKENTGCGKRLRSEINPCQSWFHVKDPLNGRVLDIPGSFAPASFWALLWKVLYSGACVGTLVWDDVDGTPYFYFSYLTSWGVLWCCLYSIASVINTVMAARTLQPAAADQAIGARIRWTWILFVLAAHTSAAATVLYWLQPLLSDQPTDHVTYLIIGPHGVLFLLTLVDGFYINRIPLRWMFWFGLCLPFDFSYFVWTIIHDFLHLGNPDNKETHPSSTDDGIYPHVIYWNKDWRRTLATSIIVVLVVGPILFALLWSISLGCCFCKDTRKYCVDSGVDPPPSTDDSERPTVVDDVEEGSIFSK